MTEDAPVSVVLTHYNKGPLVERTVASLMASPELIREILVVDDASTLPAWPESRARLRAQPRVRVIDNTENRGPAVRLNQGLALAGGRYVFFMDGDDVVGAGVLAEMLTEMRRRQADLVYGEVRKIPAGDPVWMTPSPAADWRESDRSLDFMLKHNVIQMCALCDTAVARKAGGCDDGVFIQDESLALRLSLAANRILYRAAPSVFVLLEGGESGSVRAGHRLSRNLDQQHHDAFLTFLRFRERHAAALTPAQHDVLAARTVSCYWKSRRCHHRRTAGDLLVYVLSRLAPRTACRLAMPRMRAYFAGLATVRRNPG